MIKLHNCTITDAKDKFSNKKIVPFGLGAWFNFLQYTALRDCADSVAYIIDNKPDGKTACFAGKDLSVYSPEKLREEKNCVVLLTSPVYMYDMYIQLTQMDLDESVECYAFPLMQLVSNVKNNPELEKKVLDSSRPRRIPKTIHSFWFSGEEKPDSYKRCVDTWRKVCPDYKIIEWTKDNYDFTKNEFCKKAIEVGAWAYASDFARLDVVNSFGGIYLDMDVEVLKPFDDLLSNKAFFSFSNNVNVDMAIFASEANNNFIHQLLSLYENVQIPAEKKGFSAFFQPSHVAKSLHDIGLQFDGSMQVIDDMLFLPRNYLMPLDVVLFDLDAKDERTYSVHYDNFGWSTAQVNNRDKKISDNRKLWEMVER